MKIKKWKVDVNHGGFFLALINTKIIHIEIENLICYNADRQIKAVDKSMRTTKSPGVAALGLFYSQFWQWQGLEP